MANHAENNSTDGTIPGLTAERVKAIATLAVTLFALVNAGLNLAGVDTLPFTDDQVAAAIYGVIGTIGTVYGWWKNQNITKEAATAQTVLDGLKANPAMPGVTAVDDTAIAVASGESK